MSDRPAVNDKPAEQASAVAAEPEAMIDEKVERERRLLVEARERGRLATLGAYVKLSGPGWLQSAITLGGGSLAGSLYLGVIGGYQFMWLQPLMMILGVVMLSAIAYVTLSSDERPFAAINRHINPVLGWGWLIGAMMANMVWAMPQFSLGHAALEQNLLPGVIEGDAGKWTSIGLLAVCATIVIVFYDSGGWGLRLFELLLKLMVAVIVVSFFGVVAAMSMSGSLPWGEILAGFVPDFSLLHEPSRGFADLLPQTADAGYWRDIIVTQQRDVMITAAATAVGINMTFLLPYSMLRKGWGRQFRGLAVFDLSTGLFIPFVLATSCVVIASASRFHVEITPEQYGVPAAEISGGFRTVLQNRVLDGPGGENLRALDGEARAAAVNTAIDALPDAERQVAYKLVQRDAFALAQSLERLTDNRVVSQYVFGIGVLGMAISTIIILMLINGFCLVEMLHIESRPIHLIGCLVPAITGALGFYFLWSDEQARFWLAVPTSRIGMILLPVAYITFFLMMNSRSLLGGNRPTGMRGLAVNGAMILAIAVATIGCGLAIWNTTMKVPGTDLIARWPVLTIVALFVLLAVIVHMARAGNRREAA